LLVSSVFENVCGEGYTYGLYQVRPWSSPVTS
jgi:hypothetical protein